MHRAGLGLCAKILRLSALLPAALSAQDVPLNGTVTDSATGGALAGARVEARVGGEVVRRSLTDIRGRFRLRLAPGWYTVAIAFVGYYQQAAGIGLTDTAPSRMNIALAPKPAELPDIVVASRDSQSILDAPTAVTIVDQKSIEGRITVTPADHLRDVPGIDIAHKGLSQATFSARGPSAVNSAALLIVHDYRNASVPGLRLNVPYFIPTTNDDLDRIEIARGPGSAIYGPDADRGVVNFVTKSPFDSRGTTLSIASGGRSVLQADFRHAAQLGERVAVKLSGEYFRGRDWPFVDTNEVRPRDERIERAMGEARLDWRAGDHTMVILSGGVAQAFNNVDLTEVGSIQVRDWRYTFGHARVLRDRLFVNLFYNQNDAGKSFQLYRPLSPMDSTTGAPIVDDSRAMSAQVQYGSSLGSHFDLTYGLDVQRVVPQSSGTIYGRHEDDDGITQTGLYLNSATALSSRWSLVASARADHHNRLDDLAMSPRAGLIFKPGDRHALRITFNRGSSTPVATDLFLDLEADASLPGFPIRGRGTIEPFTFRRDCNGGLCMRSPFVGDATAFIPLDATVAWPALQQILNIPQVPAPTAQQVSTVLGVLNRDSTRFDPTTPLDVTDIAAAKRSYNSTLEAGYRWYLGSRFSVSLDAYYTRLTNVATALAVQTPNAFLEQTSLESYLAADPSLTPQQAAQLAALGAMIPLGTVSPEQGDSTEILLIGRQGARANFWGADLAVTAELGAHFSVDGTYSWTSKDIVRGGGGSSDIVFNAPKQKGNLGVTYRHQAGLTADLRGRAVASFPVKSGVYADRVNSYGVIDASLSFRLPWAAQLTFGLSIANLLDNQHREFVGAPEIGRLVIARVRGTF